MGRFLFVLSQFLLELSNLFNKTFKMFTFNKVFRINSVIIFWLRWFLLLLNTRVAAAFFLQHTHKLITFTFSSLCFIFKGLKVFIGNAFGIVGFGYWRVFRSICRD